jgi:hypothetical protein
MRSPPALQARLAEMLMSALAPCVLGGDIEVVHDVESLEIEMECTLDEDEDEDSPDAPTKHFAREDVGTHQFVRFSAPYERIEIQLDGRSFIRATIEDARQRSRALRE